MNKHSLEPIQSSSDCAGQESVSAERPEPSAQGADRPIFVLTSTGVRPDIYYAMGPPYGVHLGDQWIGNADTPEDAGRLAAALGSAYRHPLGSPFAQGAPWSESDLAIAAMWEVGVQKLWDLVGIYHAEAARWRAIAKARNAGLRAAYERGKRDATKGAGMARVE